MNCCSVMPANDQRLCHSGINNPRIMHHSYNFARPANGAVVLRQHTDEGSSDVNAQRATPSGKKTAIIKPATPSSR
jgi:hypothetical protein